MRILREEVAGGRALCRGIYKLGIEQEQKGWDEKVRGERAKRVGCELQNIAGIKPVHKDKGRVG